LRKAAVIFDPGLDPLSSDYKLMYMRKGLTVSLCGMALLAIDWLLAYFKWITVLQNLLIAIVILAAVITIKVRGKMYRRRRWH
jgi:hypothetical protein